MGSTECRAAGRPCGLASGWADALCMGNGWEETGRHVEWEESAWKSGAKWGLSAKGRPTSWGGVGPGPPTSWLSIHNPVSRFLPPPIPGHFPLFIEDRLFSLISNLFLYDLLKLFTLSTIKPLKRSKTNKQKQIPLLVYERHSKRVCKCCIGTRRWQDGREAYCGNVIYNHLNVYLIHVLKRYLTCPVWFHKWFKEIFKYVWHLFW